MDQHLISKKQITWPDIQAATTGDLTPEQEQALRDQERIIDETVGSAFYVIGRSLSFINFYNLHLKTHLTFESYVRDRFDIARRTAYQHMAAAQAVDNVRNCAQIECVPANEAQARPLTRLESPEDQVKAWEKAVEMAGGKPTASQVESIVKKMGNKESKKGQMKPRTAKAAPTMRSIEQKYDKLVAELQRAKRSGFKDINLDIIRHWLNSANEILTEVEPANENNDGGNPK